MNMLSANILSSVILICCFGYVQNKRKIKSVNIYDPESDINLNSIQLINKYGNTPQRHSVVTEDGYIVNVYRIPQKGPAVLLVHGIGDSSDSWLVTGPSYSLAFQLSELGYDVWLYNARGNKYSQNHVKNLPSKQYWDFSYEEMGARDLPAVVDYILKLKYQPKLHYIAFSQGTTLFFIMCSLRPEYNEKIQHAILLAPVAWLDSVKYPFMDFFAMNSDFMKSFLDSIGVYKLFENNIFLKLYHAKVCQDEVPEQILCQLEFALTYGVKNLTNLNIQQLPVISSHISAGVSTKTFEHFFQIYSSKRFQRYDFGAKKNLEIYASVQPPEFDVSAISVPVSIFVSDSDWFSTVEDVKLLRMKLQNVINYVEFNKSLDFTHLEFVYGERATRYINNPVVDILLTDAYNVSML